MTRLLRTAHELVRVTVSSQADCLHELRAPVKNRQQFQTGQILASSHRRPQLITALNLSDMDTLPRYYAVRAAQDRTQGGGQYSVLS